MSVKSRKNSTTVLGVILLLAALYFLSQTATFSSATENFASTLENAYASVDSYLGNEKDTIAENREFKSKSKIDKATQNASEGELEDGDSEILAFAAGGENLSVKVVANE